MHAACRDCRPNCGTLIEAVSTPPSPEVLQCALGFSFLRSGVAGAHQVGWYVAVAPIDLRCGIDRLLVKVQSELGRDVRDGSAYVFRNRAATRIKVLRVDAQGIWLSARRLHEGRFVWPRVGDELCVLSSEQFAWLSAGVDWQRLSLLIEVLPPSV